MLKKIRIKIKGISDESCKALIEKQVSVLKGVQSIKVDHRTGECEVVFEGDSVTQKDILGKIRGLGYEIGNDLIALEKKIHQSDIGNNNSGNLHKIVVPIAGMHCRSCEMIVEENLKNIPGVKKVEVNYRSGKAEIFTDKDNFPKAQIEQAVKNAGYSIGRKNKLEWISKDKDDYMNLIKGALILIIIYYLAKSFGLFSIGVNTESTSLFVVLMVGLVAGVSTCMALVGGLVLSISARHAEAHPEITAKQKFTPHIYFNLGRILGFGLLGGLLAMAGTAFQPSSGTLGLMTIIIGGVMIFLGLKLIEIFPALKDKSISLPKSISRALGIKKEQKEYSHKGSFITGALTFFLPCGFTQAMQLFAISSGSFTDGALVMAVFALGTAPGLLGIGGLASIFKGKKARVFFAATGLAVILLGALNISNGSVLAFQGRTIGTDSGNSDSGEVQEIKMTQNTSGYFPNKFTVEKGKKVKWIITSTDQFTCASSFVVPKYGITKYFKKGENIIEFTPKETGEIPFSCSMGMYRGKIIVIDSKAGITADKAEACKVSIEDGSNAPPGASDENVQAIKASYTRAGDILPKNFEVKKGKPVRFEIDAKESGSGCMAYIAIPGLCDDAQYLEGGKKIIMSFTPQNASNYRITCSMGSPRGAINVVN